MGRNPVVHLSELLSRRKYARSWRPNEHAWWQMAGDRQAPHGYVALVGHAGGDDAAFEPTGSR
jgi:hypothetical protein